MKLRALTSFAGLVSMYAGEVRDVEDEAIVRDLLRAGYAEVAIQEAEIVEKPAEDASEPAENVGEPVAEETSEADITEEAKDEAPQDEKPVENKRKK